MNSGPRKVDVSHIKVKSIVSFEIFSCHLAKDATQCGLGLKLQLSVPLTFDPPTSTLAPATFPVLSALQILVPRPVALDVNSK